MNLFVKRLKWISLGFESLWVPVWEQLAGPRSRVEPGLAIIRGAVHSLLSWFGPRLATILTAGFVAGWVADAGMNLVVFGNDFASWDWLFLTGLGLFIVGFRLSLTVSRDFT